MADVTDANTPSEPSMEEILASIRRIIADEKDPAAPAAEAQEPATNGVLDLTQMIADDGSIVTVKPETEVAAAPPPPPPPPPPAPPLPSAAPAALDENEVLLSDIASTAATSSLETLVNTLHVEQTAANPSISPLGNGGRTLEDMVLELMRPLLKAWLDENLPPIVDRLVQKEVERIVRRVRE